MAALNWVEARVAVGKDSDGHLILPSQQYTNSDCEMGLMRL
jgi:hypothetical protein